MSLQWQPADECSSPEELFAPSMVRPDPDVIRLFVIKYDRGGQWSIGFGSRELHRGDLAECVAVAENKECKLLEAWEVIEGN